MAGQQRVQVARDLPASVDRVFGHLARHENMGRLFAPAQVRRLTDGAHHPNGVGSTRWVEPGPFLGFVETVTDFRSGRLIEYRITRGGPLRNHLGRMTFSRLANDRSRVEFDIRFEGRFPGAGPLFALILRRSIARGLDALAADPALLGPQLPGPGLPIPARPQS